MNIKYWFVVHSEESFKKHPDLIAFKESNRHIEELKKGDKAVYYCKGSTIIKGIFEIIEITNEYKAKDYPIKVKIIPYLLAKKEIIFTHIPNFENLDMFKRLYDKSRWGACIQGKSNVVKPLSEHDFRMIEKYIKSV